MNRQTLYSLVLAALVLAACTKQQERVLLPAGVDITDSETPWRWGYVNEQGEMLIKPQFEDAAPFSDGFAHVKLNGVECFIDSMGNVHYPPDTLLWADDFHNGVAHVGKTGSYGEVYYGVIDKNFLYVQEPVNDNIEGYEYEPPYRDDRYIMNVEEWYLTDDFDSAAQTTTLRLHRPDNEVVYEWKWHN